jgi:hypothetical protein
VIFNIEKYLLCLQNLVRAHKLDSNAPFLNCLVIRLLLAISEPTTDPFIFTTVTSKIQDIFGINNDVSEMNLLNEKQLAIEEPYTYFYAVELAKTLDPEYSCPSVFMNPGGTFLGEL